MLEGSQLCRGEKEGGREGGREGRKEGGGSKRVREGEGESNQ